VFNWLDEAARFTPELRIMSYSGADRHAQLKDLDKTDLIVSDICMPGMTGLEVLARVRASSIHLPVVLITAFGDEQTRNRAAALGGTVLFSKPFDMDDLRTAVMFLLAGEPHQRPAPQDLA
jgi:CheY-like chemotaxis protein